jgi:two-component system, chemotaxis family, protein-glutamate methylesterase/glutaminase
VIASQGGATLVQDPEDALYPGMPASAIAHVVVDAVAPLARVAETIAAFARGRKPPEGIRGSDPALAAPPSRRGLTLVCPECGGVLSERDETGVPQWHCHVGHTYGPASLAEAQGAAVEAALWTALRSMEDRAALMRRLAEQADRRGQRTSTRLFAAKADRVQEQADLLRGVVCDTAAVAERTTAGDVA